MPCWSYNLRRNNNGVLLRHLPAHSKGRFTRYDFFFLGLRQAHDMIYDCCVRQKECCSILKHVLKRCDSRKSCRRSVVRLPNATKIVPCKLALRKPWLIVLFHVLRRTFGTIFLLKLGVPILLYLLNRSLRHFT